MDNAKFHHSREMQNFFTINSIIVKFFPPYSPQLNSIEEFFSMFKSRFYALTFEIITEKIQDALNFDFTIEFRNFYNNMLVWLDNARARLNFI
ncbi:hypothetical protein GVAV_002793 [Gurleya vavrai]